MKYLPLLLLLGFGACQEKPKDHFVLRGTIPGAMDSTEIVLSPRGKYHDRIAEGYIINGKFELQGKTNQPVYCHLSMNNQDAFSHSGLTDQSLCKYVEIDFFVENGELTFQTPHIDSLPQSFWRYDVRKEKNYSLKGSSAQDIFFEYQQQSIPLRHEIRTSRNTYMQTKRVEDFKRQQEAQEKLEKQIMHFIRQHDNLPVNLHLAQQLLKEPFTYNQIYLDQVNQLFNSYQDTAKALKDFRESLVQASALVQGTPLQEEKIITTKGDTIKLTSQIQNGKYTLIDFWASWCIPCRASFPHLRKMYEQRGNQINFISISIDKAEKDWYKALDEEKLPWPQFLGSSQTAKNISKNYNIKSIPTFLLINPDGKIIFSGHDSGELEIALEKNL